MPQARHRLPARIALFLFSLLLLGCEPTDSEAGSTAGPPLPEAPNAVELAGLMGEMQRHSAKLGYSITGRNKPLAQFYLHEIEEVLGELLTVESHDGMPIAHPAQVILNPALLTLEEQIGQEEDHAQEENPEPNAPVDWPRAWKSYEALIGACNRCHQATEHGFIEILPARGVAPYNQRFSVEP